eukprot:2425144-Pyramimonas_sp.AAC.1
MAALFSMSLSINPNTGELGQESCLLRFCCWLCGQHESRGPRGMCGAVDGDCWYKAELWSYSIPGLLRRYALVTAATVQRTPTLVDAYKTSTRVTLFSALPLISRCTRTAMVFHDSQVRP